MIVAFVEGNPDTPILIGSVYSAAIAPLGVFVVRNPGPGQTPHVFVLVPAGTPGVSVMRCPLC